VNTSRSIQLKREREESLVDGSAGPAIPVSLLLEACTGKIMGTTQQREGQEVRI